MERDFFTVLDQALARLHSHGRVSYNALKLQFHLDDAHLAVLKEGLLYTHPEVVDDEGRGLIWTGSIPPVAQTNSRHTEPTGGTVETTSAPSDAVPVLPATPVRPSPEAERRQLTVLFCDLVGSTPLSGQLDPEDWRAVVRAYQEAAAAVIQPYAGHIAQYLGDGLLVYFGYPTAHEDEARRAVHAGLGMVQAITTLNARLAAPYGVQLAVRVGIHTGPVVVGQMGGGARHEHLALGETPNLAARLQALAPTNAVVISAVTARLVQGTFALEDLGTHAPPGVAEPMAVCRVRGLLAWEDLHWADPTTPELLGLVIEQAPTVPMLHVLTYHPAFSPPWPPRSHITPLVLTGPLRTVAIPDTLQDALMARLDQLNRAKEVAQLGAVLGRQFAYELLQAIAPQDEDTLQAGLAQLVAAELLYQRGRPPRARYLFKHALIQDAAYASLLKRTHQHVHQQVAEVFEARFPALVETQPELVAQHYTAAGCPEPAGRYWQRACQQASERSAYLEAVSHVTTGIELLTTLPETPARPCR